MTAFITLIWEHFWRCAAPRVQMVQMLEMNVYQTGKNVAVIQPKCNNCDEGQFLGFFFFCLLCCSVQKTGQSFTASSFLTLTQLGEQRKEKTVSSSHIHTGNSSLCFLYVNDKSWWLKDCCPLWSVNWHSLSRPTKLLQKGVYSFDHCIFALCSSEQFVLFLYEHYIYWQLCTCSQVSVHTPL